MFSYNSYIPFSIILLSTVAHSFQETSTVNNNNKDEYILCRSCGSDISSSNYLVSIPSPFYHYATNDTLFTKKVLIQALSNGIFDFPVITVKRSDCTGVGEWEEKESWFPGFRWKLCMCPDCGEYVGWLFEPLMPVQTRDKPFFGLMLYALIGESCKYCVRLDGWCGLSLSTSIIVNSVMQFLFALIICEVCSPCMGFL